MGDSFLEPVVLSFIYVSQRTTILWPRKCPLLQSFELQEHVMHEVQRRVPHCHMLEIPCQGKLGAWYIKDVAC